MARQLEVLAINLSFSPSDYQSPDGFVKLVSSAFESVDLLRERDRLGRFRWPALVVFPRNIGTLLFLMGQRAALEGSASMGEFLGKVALRALPRLLWLRTRHGVAGLSALFHMAARDSWETWYNTFSCLARRHQVTVVAGSLIAPDNRFGATNTFLLDGHRTELCELSATFDPRGELINLTKSVSGISAAVSCESSGSAAPPEYHPFSVAEARCGNLMATSLPDLWGHAQNSSLPSLDRLTELFVLPAALDESLYGRLSRCQLKEVGHHAETLPAEGTTDPIRMELESLSNNLFNTHPSLTCVVSSALLGQLFELPFDGRACIRTQGAVFSASRPSASRHEIVRLLAVLPGRTPAHPVETGLCLS